MTLSKACHTGLLALFLIATPASARDQAQGNPVGTAPGPLDGNWRVTRADDPFDAALMLMQIQQDGRRIVGDYVLFQPFCGIDLPPAAAGAETCEFDGVSEDVSGRVRGGRATIVFRPGADEQPHRLIIPAKPSNGRLEGRYLAPGESLGIAVRLSRPPE